MILKEAETPKEMNAALKEIKREYGDLSFQVYYDLKYIGEGYPDEKTEECMERWGYCWDMAYRNFVPNSGDQDIEWGEIKRAYMGDYMKLPGVVELVKEIKSYKDIYLSMRFDIRNENEIFDVFTVPERLFSRKGVWLG